jgi:hypothetical protein
MEPVLLQGESRIRLGVAEVVRIVETEDVPSAKAFEVAVSNYFYRLAGEDGNELFAFHWTPDSIAPGEVTFPHLHIGPGLTTVHRLQGGNQRQQGSCSDRTRVSGVYSSDGDH